MDAESKRKIMHAFGLLCAGALIGCICTLLYCGSRSDAPAAGGNGERTAEQVNRAAELNELAGAEVDAAAGAVGRAEQHAERAAELNQSAQAGTADSKELVEQLKADNRRAKQLIDELIGEHQAGQTTDGAH